MENFWIQGKKDSKRAIVIIHGFGVNRYEHGFYRYIGDALERDNLVIYADLIDRIKPGLETVLPFSKQVERLKQALTEMESQFGKKEIVFISRSQGFIAAAELMKEFPRSLHIALCPYYDFNIDRFTGHFKKRPQTVINLVGETLFARSGGNFTQIMPEYWQEFNAVRPYEILAENNANHDLYMLIAEQDQLVDEGYKTAEFNELKPSLRVSSIGTDHDMSGYWTEVYQMIQSILSLQSIKPASEDELLQWVDINNEIVGTILRSVAHGSLYLTHREIFIFLYNSNKELLLQKRAPTKATNPNAWRPIAGHVDATEEPIHAASRELAEEMGITVELKPEFEEFNVNSSSTESRYFSVYSSFYEGTDFKLDPTEASEAKYFPFDMLSPIETPGKIAIGDTTYGMWSKIIKTLS
jgi:isopentenyl-diphosphate delta-isomerase